MQHMFDCDECLEAARESYQRQDITREELNWWCWMFACNKCHTQANICGGTKE